MPFIVHHDLRCLQCQIRDHRIGERIFQDRDFRCFPDQAIDDPYERFVAECIKCVGVAPVGITVEFPVIVDRPEIA